jgi:thiamine-monophosphate kinase
VNLSEVEVVRRIRRHAGKPAGLVLGIGDDCAVFRPRHGEDLVFTTDLFIEDVHFERGWPAPALGRRTLARGLSDIAAMGADPRFCLLSLALPERPGTRWLDGYFRGFLEWGVPLAGGDLSRSSKLTADIVVCGSVPKGKALRRDGARAGDAIFVSGRLGGAAAGGFQADPQPRLALGRYLRGRATACMDLSDGLSTDLHRLAEASRLAAEISAPPIAEDATPEQALHGGEDYELLFTANPDLNIRTQFRGLPLTRIGTMRKGKPGTVFLDGRPLPPLGYDHFARSVARR